MNADKLWDAKDHTESQYSVIGCGSDIECEMMLIGNWIGEYGCELMWPVATNHSMMIMDAKGCKWLRTLASHHIQLWIRCKCETLQNDNDMWTTGGCKHGSICDRMRPNVTDHNPSQSTSEMIPLQNSNFDSWTWMQSSQWVNDVANLGTPKALISL